MVEQVPKIATIHCSATENGVHASIQAIHDNHVQRGLIEPTDPWLGYHAVIMTDGSVIPTRPLNLKGAHVGGANTGNIGICLIGTDKFTITQFESLRTQLESLKGNYGIQFWNVNTHNQFPSAIAEQKVCPSIKINNLLGWLFTGSYEPIAEHLL